MPGQTPRRDWQNPWIWIAAALLVGVALFANFARDPSTDVKATDWVLAAGRTGAGDGVPSSTAAPDEFKGKIR